MSKWRSYREDSRIDWGQEYDKGEVICDEQLKIGALLRIADALEIQKELAGMTPQDVVAMKRELENTKIWWRNAQRGNESRDRTISGLRGVITKLKRRTA